MARTTKAIGGSKFPLAILLLWVFCWGVFHLGSAWALPYYQLRDVSGERDGHTIAGSQWFATVLENRWINSVWSADWDTHGGEAPGVPVVTSADLIHDFSSVYLEDPLHDTTLGDDVSFDPIQSMFLVLKEGQGELKLNFGNNYVYHGPYSPTGSQDVMEDVLLSVPDYNTRVVPGSPELVNSGDWLLTTMSFQADLPESYGSSLGYLTFRQSASFDSNFTGYRESIKIPLVVANVSNGSAAEPGNELYFDMTLFSSNDVLTRHKFRWGADENGERNLGTFFMIQSKDVEPLRYELVTRITNRTGTRYRNQRYDTLNSIYRDIPPLHWAYDLTPDLYGSLPPAFQLDPQSQIAPGLTTVFSSSMDMVYGSSESFRLYPYRDPAAPRDLRLLYRKVGGMVPYGAPISPISGDVRWSVTGFEMTFADVARNEENTKEEIAQHAGGTPTMPATGYILSNAAVTNRYFKADAFNSLMISADVPSVTGSDDIALLPVQIRLRISRRELPIVDRWEELSNADSVINAFANICAVWVRSPNAAEQDMNLFTTLNNRGYSVESCVQAFTHEDFLYLDFIVLIADAVSQNIGKTAFCQVVKDDGVPYILIGDGKVDERWTLGFYVDRTGSGSILDSSTTPDESYAPFSSEGGCNQGIGLAISFAAMCSATIRFVPVFVVFILKKLQRKNR
ncbi:MAG: hypothetical protein LBJ36_05010 [Synergistaceae bacterium]|jgi:hypothetical protein|nr:hypothetical protein [Synergistaceae bacterium]